MKKIFLAAALLSCSLFSDAQTQDTPQPVTPSLLWRITGPRMKQPSYLFGTAHLICPDQYLWTNEMKGALAQCTELCLEMNVSDQGELMKVMTTMSDPARKLETYFSPQQYKEVAQYFTDSFHTSLSTYTNMKPVVLVGIMEQKTLDCATPASYEFNLIDAAHERKMVISGLEDADETIKITGHITSESVVADLVDLAEGKYRGRALNKVILDAYARQDIGTISDVAREELKENVGPLLDDRNKDWVKKMPSKMQERPVFFAVGAGHLAGKNGVIRLLRDAGYRVEPVR